MPGSIRNAELFVRFMRHVVRYLKERIRVAAVESVTPTAFLRKMGEALAIDVRPLQFAYTRLGSLLRTLQATGGAGGAGAADEEDFGPIQLVADFVTLLATYPVGFLVLLEPFNAKTPHVPDPVMQLACLDASLAIRPVFEKFSTVLLTSGTLSPIDLYPKLLAFRPAVRAQLEMSIERPCICPLVVSRAADQTALTTRFEAREDPAVLQGYASLLVQLCSTVPDGVVAFFPSYAYMQKAIAAWHALGALRLVEQVRSGRGARPRGVPSRPP